MRFPPGRGYRFFPDPDLRQRLRVLVHVRYAVAIAIVLGAHFAYHMVGITDLQVGALSVLAAALFLCNTFTYFAIRPHRNPGPNPEPVGVFLERVLHFSVATDFIGLTVALWLVGGPFSPFTAFFVFNVIIASVLLSPRAAYTHASLAYALLSMLIISTWQGWIPAHYPRGAVAVSSDLSGRYVFTVLMVQGLLIMLTALLTIHLMNALRQGREELLAANEKLERVSQLRRDFLHIALHNLRSPVGAVAMHLSNMAHGYGGPLSDSQRDWVGRAQYRLHELTRFLHDLEYMAALEAEEFEQHTQDVDIAEIVDELVEDNRDLAEKARHTFTVEKNAGNTTVAGIPRLIREALANYITNAIKYTPGGGTITVRVIDQVGAVRVEVQDNGIGIAEKDQSRLFHELVRVHQPNSAVGDVGGSGLGLYIVQRIAEMHHARIEVKSRPGDGSTFSITFPKNGHVDAGSAPINGSMV